MPASPLRPSPRPAAPAALSSSLQTATACQGSASALAEPGWPMTPRPRVLARSTASRETPSSPQSSQQSPPASASPGD